MLTESELVTIMEDQDVLDATMDLKAAFIGAETDFLNISDDDFISLVLLAPSVGVALANGSISLFEELSLNKKARKLSRGSYFLKKDPIVQALQFLVKNFEKWEDKFYNLIKMAMFSTFKKNQIILDTLRNPQASTGDLSRDMLNAPYIFVKFITFLFMEEEDDLLNQRSISQIEYQKILEIGQKLEIDNVPAFQLFCKTFMIR